MRKKFFIEWVRSLKSNITALYFASRDSKVPVLAKVVIGVAVAYALSPIDLIPDFIPVLGYLDDIILLPLGIWFAIRLIPGDVWLECQKMALQKKNVLPESRRAAVVIVIFWIVMIVSFIFLGRNLICDSVA